MKYYLAFDIGCMECGESSSVIGVYKTQNEAIEAIKNYRNPNHKWGKAGRIGEHSEEVFEIEIPE